MFAAFLITFREGLEAALILGIVLGVLTRLGMHRMKRWVWAGMGAALGLSLAAALLLVGLGRRLEGRIEQLYEGLTMLAAAALLTWMLFWMSTHAAQLKEHLSQRTRAAAGSGAWALFAVAFVAVIREGLETALFWTALFFQSAGHKGPLYLGGVLGLLVAVMVGVAVFQGARRLHLRWLFLSTGMLLLLVAAGLLAHGVHELQEAAFLPVFVEHLWDTSALLAEESVAGRLLTSLFGYNANPSLLEVLTYWLYLLAAGPRLWQFYRGQRPREAAAA